LLIGISAFVYRWIDGSIDSFVADGLGWSIVYGMLLGFPSTNQIEGEVALWVPTNHCDCKRGISVLEHRTQINAPFLSGN
jgi:hypothetical protein